MKTENTVGDKSCHWKVIKGISKVFPDVRIAVFSEAFVIETVHLGDLFGLVVTTENGDS